MDIDAYLRRIHYSGSTAPTLDTLRALHQAQLLSVPFENLDIHWKRPIQLNTNRLFSKIVVNKRGGFCYELNGLFGALLRQLGFEVTLLSARVFNGEGVLGPEHDHLALMATLEKRWLADVGFGDSSMIPLDLDERDPQTDGRRQYRIEERSGFWYVSRLTDENEWKDDFQFTLKPHTLDEFEETCQYQQTSPESPFTQRQVCTMATPTGRITLRGLSTEMKVISTINGNKSESFLIDPSEVSEMLRNQFGIVR